MRLVVILLAVTLAGCTGVSALMIANGTALGVSSVTLVCDWAQTRHIAADGWGELWENNPIMGLRPSTSVVDGYFAAVLAINVLAWCLIPRRWRMALPIALALWQGYIVIKNSAIYGARVGGMCGIR